jgi:hypothetical protein
MMLVAVLGDGLMITGFVFVMMLIVEYLNVDTGRCVARRQLARGRHTGAALSASPGAGSFAAVSLCTMARLPGAIAANMIIASGDGRS